jgi:hypothetical protein
VANGLDRQEISRRYQGLIGEIFRRAKSPLAVAVELKRMGFVSPDGGAYSESAMRSWRRTEHMPDPEQLMALAVRFGVSLDEYVTGAALEVKLTDQLERQGRQMAWLTARLQELALRTGHGDILDASPSPDDAAPDEERAQEA